MMLFNKVGKVALGSRMRLLSENIMEDAKKVYQMYGVDLKPKWFPVFYILSKENEESVMAIAKAIGHSHPSVSKIVREMVKHGIVEEKKDKKDGRKSVLKLTAKGKAEAERIEEQYIDVNSAVENTIGEMTHNIWKAMEELEFLLDQKSMLLRVRSAKKKREMEKVQIVPYHSKYRKVFYDINAQWIKQYFVMEESDHKALDHPKEYILDKGGHILVAIYEGQAVGVCALIKMDHPEYGYELAKMGVDPKAQGKGIGWLLGQAIADKSRELGAKKIFLESNTIMVPAITLYHKLGFTKIVGPPSPYERCNIQMELVL